MRVRTIALCLTPLSASGCAFIALMGGLAALDSDPDGWLQRQLHKGDGEWNVAHMQLREFERNGTFLNELIVDDDSTFTFTNNESVPFENAGWDEREGVWHAPDADVDLHWDATSAGTVETLNLVMTLHGSPYGIPEGTFGCTVADDVDSDNVDLECGSQGELTDFACTMELERL